MGMKGSCDSMPHLATESFLTKEQQDRIKGTFDDFVVVVRCKDCIHWDKGHTEECDNSDSVCFHNGWCKPDWFCADGERAENARLNSSEIQNS